MTPLDIQRILAQRLKTHGYTHVAIYGKHGRRITHYCESAEESERLAKSRNDVTVLTMEDYLLIVSGSKPA